MKILLLCLLLLCTGCFGGQSVRHLPSNLWKQETSQRVQMRYLTFQYTMTPDQKNLNVKGEAFPVVAALPDWASWYGEIILTVYIADAAGNVLAEHAQALNPQPLKREASIPFKAFFDLGTDRDQPLYVSFGYRLALSDLAPEGQAPRKLVVSEMALEQ